MQSASRPRSPSSRDCRDASASVAATSASCVQALRVFAVARVALVHPPWFDVAANELGRVYFESQGFRVVSSASAALPHDPRLIEPVDVFEWTSRHVADDAEAVFIGGNGFRAAGAIADLEAAIDRPILTANQVLLWNLLRHTDADFELTGYGCLFARVGQRDLCGTFGIGHDRHIARGRRRHPLGLRLSGGAPWVASAARGRREPARSSRDVDLRSILRQLAPRRSRALEDVGPELDGIGAARGDRRPCRLPTVALLQPRSASTPRTSSPATSMSPTRCRSLRCTASSRSRSRPTGCGTAASCGASEEAMQVALILLLAEIVVWLLSIA